MEIIEKPITHPALKAQMKASSSELLTVRNSHLHGLVGGSEVGNDSNLHSDVPAEHGGQGSNNVGESSIECDALLVTQVVNNTEYNSAKHDDEDKHDHIFLEKEGVSTIADFLPDALHCLDFFLFSSVSIERGIFGTLFPVDVD